MKRILLSVLCFFVITSSASAADVQGLLDAGDVAAASARLEQAVQSAEGDALAQALTGLSQIALSEGRNEDASKYALALSAKLEDASFVGKLEHGKRSGWFVISLWLSARVSTAQGKVEEAQAFLKRAASALSGAKVSDSWKGAIYMDYSHAIAGDEKYSRKYAEDAIEIYDALSDLHGKGHAELWLGDLELGRGKARRAISHYESALRNLKKSAEARCVFEARLHAAEKLTESGEVRAAKSHVSVLRDEFVAAGSLDIFSKRVEVLTSSAE